jgi:hypothetical protein
MTAKTKIVVGNHRLYVDGWMYDLSVSYGFDQDGSNSSLRWMVAKAEPGTPASTWRDQAWISHAEVKRRFPEHARMLDEWRRELRKENDLPGRRWVR